MRAQVKAAAQVYFGCSSLQGAEVENQPTGSCQIMGSHWEQRIFMNSVMASTLQPDGGLLNPVTLALFEDSGWYKANYSMAASFKYRVDWGFNQGCDFALNKCLALPAPYSTGDPAHYCTDASGDRTCTVNRYFQQQL